MATKRLSLVQLNGTIKRVVADEILKQEVNANEAKELFDHVAYLLSIHQTNFICLALVDAFKDASKQRAYGLCNRIVYSIMRHYHIFVMSSLYSFLSNNAQQNITKQYDGGYWCVIRAYVVDRIIGELNSYGK